jgi:hypothetical protein
LPTQPQTPGGRNENEDRRVWAGATIRLSRAARLANNKKRSPRVREHQGRPQDSTDYTHATVFYRNTRIDL